MRHDGRAFDQLRPIRITRGFTQTPAGSVLWQQGKTIVLCTASISQDVPPWFSDDHPGGWVTAEYVMLPAATPQRKPWPKVGHTDSRGTEIQRLIGRAVRAVVDLTKVGPHTISLDCQVLQADGGTRTAAISAAYVALSDALAFLPEQVPAPAGKFAAPGRPAPVRFDPALYDPRAALPEQLAAVSVGLVEGEIRLDLDYLDDSRANVDMNIAFTSGGAFVEIQGAAENGGGFGRNQMLEMIDLATSGCQRIMEIQRAALSAPRPR